MKQVTLYNWITVEDKEWGIHLWGDLEEYEDGSRQVVDITVRYITPNGIEHDYGTATVPAEVESLAEALLDSKDTSNDMLEHGAIH